MTKPRIYVETTIPSLYHDARTSPETVARRAWTRQWWSDAADRYELVTSLAVLEELEGDDPERSAARIALLQGVPLLPLEPAVTEIVRTYIARKLELSPPRQRE